MRMDTGVVAGTAARWWMWVRVGWLVPALLLGGMSPAAAAGGADVGVVLSVVDDTADPQVFAVTVTDHGPDDATHTSLQLDVGQQVLVDHTADPQPASAADGVACTATTSRLDCQWDRIPAGGSVAFTVQVAVEADDVIAARLVPAGTPDPNPQVNNADQLLLRPAVADLAVAATTAAEGESVRVQVVVEHQGGRPVDVVLQVDGPHEGAPSSCTVLDGGFRCPLGVLDAGDVRTPLDGLVPRPEPDEPHVRYAFTATAADLPDPDPTDDSAAVLVTARDRRPADVRRHEGAERIATAVAIARHLHPTGADAVVLARADDPADALSGAPLAAQVGGPILLTPPGQLAEGTAAALDDLLAPGATVHLLGGTAALDDRVADAVRALGLRVQRHAGQNRYDTSAVVAASLGSPAEVAFADGDGFTDAVVAAAAMAARGGALLLTAGDRLPPETAGWAPRADWAVGTGASQAVRGAVALVGTTPAETSVAVADRLFDAPSAVGLATTASFADALAGGPLTAAAGAPLLLTDGTALDTAVHGWLARTATIDTAHLLGGVGALSRAVEDDVRVLLSR